MNARRAECAVPYVAACVFVSGAASLGLEVVWSRLLRLVFGPTTLAITTILVAYMLGLGVGGLAGGRIAARLRNGVRAYGIMEVLVGLYALGVPFLLGLYPEPNHSLLAPLAFWRAALLGSPLVETGHRLWAQGAELAAALGRTGVAIRRARRYLELEPYSPDEWGLLADWLEAAGDADGAALARRNVDFAHANLIRSLHWLARWHQRFGDPDDAVRLLEAILQSDPSNAAARSDLERLRRA